MDFERKQIRYLPEMNRSIGSPICRIKNAEQEGFFEAFVEWAQAEVRGRIQEAIEAGREGVDSATVTHRIVNQMSNVRLMAGLRRLDCPPKFLQEVRSFQIDNQRTLRDLQKQDQKIQAWLEFHGRTKVTEWQSDFRVFLVNDGETHHIAARSASEVREVMERDYFELEEDATIDELAPSTPIDVLNVDDGYEVDVKTAAEWAEVHAPYVISTSVY